MRVAAVAVSAVVALTLVGTVPAQGSVPANKAGRQLLLDTWYDMGTDDQVDICIEYYLGKARFVKRFRAGLDPKPRRMLTKADVRRVFNYVCDELADELG